ncbi:hypothetical protein [Salinibacter sp.]|uniref:hypothetical protein n=1 Tax=Salinibacter sp. TaxID=2065818 RepID=UPI0021E7E452|nr:hypothetical protein [Salinibacter sp.]
MRLDGRLFPEPLPILTPLKHLGPDVGGVIPPDLACNETRTPLQASQTEFVMIRELEKELERNLDCNLFEEATPFLRVAKGLSLDGIFPIDPVSEVRFAQMCLHVEYCLCRMGKFPIPKLQPKEVNPFVIGYGSSGFCAESVVSISS